MYSLVLYEYSYGVKRICLKFSDFYWNFDLWVTVYSMEGLVGSSQIIKIPIHGRRNDLPFVPTFSLQFARNSYKSHFGMKKQPKSCSPIVASVQPLESSTPSRFENTQPSKGFIQSI